MPNVSEKICVSVAGAPHNLAQDSPMPGAAGSLLQSNSTRAKSTQDTGAAADYRSSLAKSTAGPMIAESL
jgi:hypothetical protein